MTTLDKIKKEYQKKDGLEMRLFVDLMIANKSDKSIVNEKLDELWSFIEKVYTQGRKEERKEIIKIARRLAKKCPFMPTKDKYVYIEVNEFIDLLTHSKK